MLTEIKLSLKRRYDQKALSDGATSPSELDEMEAEQFEEALQALTMASLFDVVLDIGTGRRGRYLTRFGKQTSRVIGIDISEATVRVAKEYIERKQLFPMTYDLLVASADAIPFLNGSFTLIICSQVLEYYPLLGVGIILKEIKRVLAKNGRVIVDFPDYYDKEVWKLKEEEEASGVNFFVYRDSEIKGMILGSGFTIIQMQKADVEIQYLLRPSS